MIPPWPVPPLVAAVARVEGQDDDVDENEDANPPPELQREGVEGVRDRDSIHTHTSCIVIVHWLLAVIFWVAVYLFNDAPVLVVCSTLHQVLLCILTFCKFRAKLVPLYGLLTAAAFYTGMSVIVLTLMSKQEFFTFLHAQSDSMATIFWLVLSFTFVAASFFGMLLVDMFPSRHR